MQRCSERPSRASFQNPSHLICDRLGARLQRTVMISGMGARHVPIKRRSASTNQFITGLKHYSASYFLVRSLSARPPDSLFFGYQICFQKHTFFSEAYVYEYFPLLDSVQLILNLSLCPAPCCCCLRKLRCGCDNFTINKTIFQLELSTKWSSSSAQRCRRRRSCWIPRCKTTPPALSPPSSLTCCSEVRPL